MGLFSAFEYKSKKNGTFWLHVKDRNGSKVYFFSKESADALMSLPSGYVIKENPVTGMPMLRKDTESFWALIFPAVPKSSKQMKKTQESGQ